MKLLVAYETQIEKTGKEVHIGGKSKKRDNLARFQHFI